LRWFCRKNGLWYSWGWGVVVTMGPSWSFETLWEKLGAWALIRLICGWALFLWTEEGDPVTELGTIEGWLPARAGGLGERIPLLFGPPFPEG